MYLVLGLVGFLACLAVGMFLHMALAVQSPPLYFLLGGMAANSLIAGITTWRDSNG